MFISNKQVFSVENQCKTGASLNVKGGIGFSKFNQFVDLAPILQSTPKDHKSHKMHTGIPFSIETLGKTSFESSMSTN